IDPTTAAQLAAKFGIKIYTIGVGTSGASVQIPIKRVDRSTGEIVTEAQSIRADLDEASLMAIARITGGEYFPATDARAMSAVLGGVVAAAGPEAGYTVVPVEQRESNRVLVVDVSLSMLARDVGTSRLDAAKAIARRIIAAHQGRIALVVFEQGADVIAPLTN